MPTGERSWNELYHSYNRGTANFLAIVAGGSIGLGACLLLGWPRPLVGAVVGAVLLLGVALWLDRVLARRHAAWLAEHRREAARQREAETQRKIAEMRARSAAEREE